MELRQLEHFVAVAEERHFTRAAVRCFIAQSALSNSIRALERDVGAELFARTTRRVELTPAGEALLPEARRTLFAANSARDAVAHSQGRLMGTLAVGNLCGSLGGWMREYHRRYPDVAITVTQAGSHTLMDAIRAGRLDLAFAAIPAAHAPARLKVAQRETVRLGIASSIGHPFARHTSIDIDALRDEDFVDAVPSLPIREQNDRFFAECGWERHVAFEVMDIDSALDLVGHGLGVVLVPRSWTAVRRDLHWVELSGDAPTITIGVVVPDRPVPPPVQALLDLVEGADSLNDDPHQVWHKWTPLDTKKGGEVRPEPQVEAGSREGRR